MARPDAVGNGSNFCGCPNAPEPHARHGRPGARAARSITLRSVADQLVRREILRTIKPVPSSPTPPATSSARSSPVKGSVLVVTGVVVWVVVTELHPWGLYAEHVELAMALPATLTASTTPVIKAASRFISPFRVCLVFPVTDREGILPRLRQQYTKIRTKPVLVM